MDAETVWFDIAGYIAEVADEEVSGSVEWDPTHEYDDGEFGPGVGAWRLSFEIAETLPKLGGYIIICPPFLGRMVGGNFSEVMGRQFGDAARIALGKWPDIEVMRTMLELGELPDQDKPPLLIASTEQGSQRVWSDTCVQYI